jgi:hypothetical protein
MATGFAFTTTPFSVKLMKGTNKLECLLLASLSGACTIKHYGYIIYGKLTYFVVS